LNEQDLMIAYLGLVDTPCPRCGYSLRNLRSAICPECGDRVMLAISLAEPRMAPYITTLIAWSVGFGGSLLFSLIAFTQAPMGWWEEPSAQCMLAQLGISAAAMPLTLLFRRRLRRASRVRQWFIAALSCIFVISMSTLIVWLFDA
jgi:hypothetical protein